MDKGINLNAIKNSDRKTSKQLCSTDLEHTPVLYHTEIKTVPIVAGEPKIIEQFNCQDDLNLAKCHKNRFLAAMLAIFLGGLGIHKFYCGKIGKGVLYILFCWTYIPSVIAFIEGIIYLTESDNTFDVKHVG